MIRTDTGKTAADLGPGIQRVFELAAEKVLLLDEAWNPADGTPVFTVEGKYTTRGWTEWTQGFQYGMPILVFDGTSEGEFLELGRNRTVERMAPHLSHTGVHDHGFNNISTYGNLLRLMKEGRIPEDRWEAEFYRLALKVSGAVQASRWTELPGELGYVYTFNGPHSLFVDTIRSMRILAAAHQLGHVLMGEGDEKISLLRRILRHAETTSRYTVYFGTGRDGYDVRGRTVHEAVFNVNNGTFRCPSTQQGYSPFSTWTRGLAWILAGYAEQLEWLDSLPEEEFTALELPFFPDKESVMARFEETARAAADFYIENTPADGIPYWDTGAPGLRELGDYLSRPADPFNDWEPVDSSAAAIAAQGLLRLGRYLERKPGGRDGIVPGAVKGAVAGAVQGAAEGGRYVQAGLTTAGSLFSPPYLSEKKDHQGLLLHTIYHHPNRWDHVQKGQKVPNGESCLWGDYHLLELAVYLQRLASGDLYYEFFHI